MFEGLFQPVHLSLVLVIVLIIFGPGRPPEPGEGMGKSIRTFKKAMKEEEVNAEAIGQKEEIKA